MPTEIPDKKPSKDASAVQELEEKLKGVKKDVGSRAKDQIFDRAAAGTSGAIKKTSKSEVGFVFWPTFLLLCTLIKICKLSK